jgi:hypothetical protein
MLSLYINTQNFTRGLNGLTEFNGLLALKLKFFSATDLKSSDLAGPNSLAYPASETLQNIRNDLLKVSREQNENK